MEEVKNERMEVCVDWHRRALIDRQIISCESYAFSPKDVSGLINWKTVAHAVALEPN